MRWGTLGRDALAMSRGRGKRWFGAFPTSPRPSPPQRGREAVYLQRISHDRPFSPRPYARPAGDPPRRAARHSGRRGRSRQFRKLSKEFSDLSPIVEGVEKLRATQDEMINLAQMIADNSDPELKSMAEEEFLALKDRIPVLEREVQVMLLPRTRRTRRTPSWKCAPGPAAMRLRSSPPICSRCISATPRCMAGASRS